MKRSRNNNVCRLLYSRELSGPWPWDRPRFFPFTKPPPRLSFTIESLLDDDFLLRRCVLLGWTRRAPQVICCLPSLLYLVSVLKVLPARDGEHIVSFSKDADAGQYFMELWAHRLGQRAVLCCRARLFQSPGYMSLGQLAVGDAIFGVPPI